MRFFLLDNFSGHPWGCVEALKPFLGPFFPRKLLINMLVTLIGENSASESSAWPSLTCSQPGCALDELH